MTIETLLPARAVAFSVLNSCLVSLMGLAAVLGGSSEGFSQEETQSATMSIDIVVVDRDQLTFTPSHQGVTADAKFSLFISPFANSLEKAVRIAQDQAASTTEIKWGGNDLAEGLYHVFAVLKDRGLERVFFFDSTFTIDRSTRPGNRSPFVEYIEPRNSRLLLPGQTVNFDFIAQDLDKDALTYSLEYKCTGNEDWVALLSGFEPELQNNGRLRVEATIPAGLPTSSRCKVRVVANDGDKIGKGTAGNLMGMAPAALSFADMSTLLNAKCVACHSAANPQKNFRVDTAADIPDPADATKTLHRGLDGRIGRVVDYINLLSNDRNYMPRNGSMTQQEIEQFELYELSID